jgi:hypothetical protein
MNFEAIADDFWRDTEPTRPRPWPTWAFKLGNVVVVDGGRQ